MSKSKQRANRTDRVKVKTRDNRHDDRRKERELLQAYTQPRQRAVSSCDDDRQTESMSIQDGSIDTLES